MFVFEEAIHRVVGEKRKPMVDPRCRIPNVGTRSSVSKTGALGRRANGQVTMLTNGIIHPTGTRNNEMKWYSAWREGKPARGGWRSSTLIRPGTYLCRTLHSSLPLPHQASSLLLHLRSRVVGPWWRGARQQEVQKSRWTEGRGLGVSVIHSRTGVREGPG
jgi:hypothetical protein